MADIRINHTVPDAKAVAATQAFLRVFPNITNDPLQWPDAPLNDREWMKHRVGVWIDQTINQGRRQKHRSDNPEPADDSFLEA